MNVLISIWRPKDIETLFWQSFDQRNKGIRWISKNAEFLFTSSSFQFFLANFFSQGKTAQLWVWGSSKSVVRLSRGMLLVLTLTLILTVSPVRASMNISISDINDTEILFFFLSLMTYGTKAFLEFLWIRSVWCSRVPAANWGLRVPWSIWALSVSRMSLSCVSPLSSFLRVSWLLTAEHAIYAQTSSKVTHKRQMRLHTNVKWDYTNVKYERVNLKLFVASQQARRNITSYSPR